MAKIYDKAQFDFYYSTKIGCPKKKTRISFVFIEYINLYLVKSRKEKQEKMIPKKKSGKRIELSTCNDPTGGRRKQKEDKGYSDFRSRDDDDLILFWDQKPIR